MKILFVCSGNTGRSPMAQFVMQKLIADAGLSEKISVS
ncbi:MAG: low molecular weight phosphotyrosine protein phosphatase, partial [Selenomonadaceae bacterium]|nr:low molecular weight phosphotyrosine protein phosphatase [Selenomonadaceae bacterium]